MARRLWGEIKDPVHGYIYITENEKKIIDTFPVQRLRRLKQLAGSEFVYPGANHTRFEHSVGVMYLAGFLTRNPNLSPLFSEEEAETVRIAALLHDVGHGPFSHIFEHLLVKFLSKIHEDMTVWIIRESELRDVIESLGYDSEVVSKLSVGSLNRPGRAFMDQIIQSSVDVDKLDFVVRDTYHTGAEYGYVDIFRLLHTLDVMNENLAVDVGALSALESLMLARMELFKSIYFHRTSRAVQLMLATAMEKGREELGLLDFESPGEYLQMDDYTIWTALKNYEGTKEFIRRLERRDLIKCCYDRTFHVRDKAISSIFSRNEIRDQIRDQIAEKAGVSSEDVYLDVPTLPSVPYSHSALLEPMEIPIFHRERDGKKVPLRLDEVSTIFDVLKGFINILRVYTEPKYRRRVGEAAEKLLGSTPSSIKISY